MADSETAREKYSPQYLAQWFLWAKCPSFYVHNSRVAQKLPQGLFDRLLGSPSLASRNHSRLSQLFLSENLNQITIDKKSWSFITMSNRCIDLLIRVTAALELGARIRRTISGDEVQALRHLLGEGVIRFVVSRYNGFYQGDEHWKSVDFSEINQNLIISLGWAILDRAGDALPPDLRSIWLIRLPQKVNHSAIKNLTQKSAFELCFSILKEVGEL